MLYENSIGDFIKRISFKVYAVATTTLEPNKKVPKFNTEDKEWETLERGFVLSCIAEFLIRFLSVIIKWVDYLFLEC